MDLMEFHHLNEVLAVLTSIVLNLTLMRLALTENGSFLKFYRKLIVLNASSELLAKLLMALSQPMFQFADGVNIFIATGPLRHLPINYHYHLLLLYAMGVGIGFLTIPLDFLYRYYVVCLERNVESHQVLLWVLIAYVLAAWDAVFMTLGFVHLSPKAIDYKPSFAFLNESMWRENGRRMTFIVGTIENPYSLTFVISASLYVTAEYISIFILSHRIMKKLAERRHLMSAKTLEMQRGMNKMLLSQALVPLFTGLFPILGMTSTLLLRLSDHRIGIVVSSMMAWLPSASPICTIWFIGSFRQRVFPFWRSSRSSHVSAIGITEIAPPAAK
ncbi:unnamed protein product [Bursaphelenchus xylophilus]|uniref:(pine wood nematode) hypothetical protein n=1 Tax=Bursaphelenchus xylophilus TaxID=6326 RepID=A0A7I8WLW5_BURXY|nr:unnamed protein product [Bursaphelenchus xylophilus]CAG9104812.1 unnamed protein product [Bursaphelenchus xylophilus]